MNITISKATLYEAKKIISFLNKVGGETNFLTFGLNDFPCTLKEEKNIISQCLNKNYKLMLVAKDGEEIIGQLFLDRSSEIRLAHIGEIGISITKDYWGKSIGMQLLMYARGWSKDNKITKLQLIVRNDNYRAIALYIKLGFTFEGRLINSMKIDNDYFDCYIMGLIL